ncbi:family 2 encapsulin nanocompartment cargo protein polyprenyl transferase [Amycolatopsis lurida]
MATAQLRMVARPAEELLGWSRSVVDPALRAAVDSLADPVRHIVGYHLGWHDERGRPATAPGGKAVRPTLALLSAEAVDGNGGGNWHEAVPAAVAVELVHNFSLLHDDVMDGDTTRRHRPTAWSVFGVSAAILAGDALLALAFEVLAAAKKPVSATAVARLSAAVRDLIDGQAADVSFERRADVELAECLTMAENKTAALMGVSCSLGALFAGATPERVERMRAFGHELGVVFQLVDDLLGVWGDPVVTGKPVWSDLRTRKKSLPVVAALGSAGQAGRELAALYHRDRPLSEEDLAHAAELIARAGGRDWVRREVDGRLARAAGWLRAADAGERAAVELAALARQLARRDH